MIKPTELRIGSIVDRVNRNADVHLPIGIPMRVIGIQAHEVVLAPLDVPDFRLQESDKRTVTIKNLCGVPLTE